MEALKPQDRCAGASHDAARLLAHLRPARHRAASFERRHNSITPVELEQMLSVVGFKSLDALIDATVPANIRRQVRC